MNVLISTRTWACFAGSAGDGGSLQGAGVTHEALAERILNELFSVPRSSGSKAYVAALCKVRRWDGQVPEFPPDFALRIPSRTAPAP